MKSSRIARPVALLALSLASLTACADGDEEGGGGTGAASGADPDEFAKIKKSCAYDCPAGSCAEADTGYVCHNLEAWSKIPHAETCGGWNGKYPKVVEGKCSASAPSGDAAKYAGTDPADATRTILPDGRRLTPAGSDWVFDQTGLGGGISTGILALPGTTRVAVVDTGPGRHVVRLVDTALIGSQDPVESSVAFDQGVFLNSGMAFVPPDLVYVPSSGGVVYALAFDVSTGTLARDDTRDLVLPDVTDKQSQPDGWYASSVAASPDGKRLVVAPVSEKTLLVYDVEAGSATFGALIGKGDLGAKETFGVYIDPSDTTGERAYVTLWSDAKVLEVSLTDPTAPVVTQSFDTAKDPQGLAFLDARWLVAGGDLGDALDLIDRTSGTVHEIPVDASVDVYGLEPSALAFDPASKRLYAALSGINAVAAYDVDLASDPPKITPAGRIPTGWWPGGIALSPAGDLAIVNLRGRGTGPNPQQFGIGDGEITDLIRGSVQQVPAPDAAALTQGAARVAANNHVSALAGSPSVSCPGPENDFPVPDTNDAPSPHIEHVFFIVRENKNFDALLGDMPGVEGSAALTLKTKTADMDAIWTNFRALAREFTIGDNYYTAAVQSTQGHVWTTYGRTNDFNERTWAISDGTPRLLPGGGVLGVGRPVEGSIFDWAGENQVRYDILGEIVGSPKAGTTPNPVDGKYPGGPFQNIGYNDDEKACYVAGRARVLCNLGQFAYITLPNDHTFGVSPKNPTPELFCAVNDDATGMVVDAISHSPMWATSLIVITEDDPLQGGEHIDSHRTPLVMVSPWVKRGYVSKTHMDTSSLHKLFAHILGKPYSNFQVENAALPLDAFASTPDYTPYTYTPRSWPLECGEHASSAEALITESWDFSEPDEQPGLGRQVARWMKGRQIEVLSVEEEEEVRARIFRLERERAAEAMLPEREQTRAAVDDDDD